MKINNFSLLNTGIASLTYFRCAAFTSFNQVGTARPAINLKRDSVVLKDWNGGKSILSGLVSIMDIIQKKLYFL